LFKANLVSIKTTQSCSMVQERSDEVRRGDDGQSLKAKPLLYLVLAMVVLGALYAIVKPQLSVEGARSGAAERAPAADAQLAPPVAAVAQATDQVRVLYAKPNVFDIVVQRGRRVSEPAVIKVHQGDEVTLHITTDSADELHLHGYNLHVQLSPEKTATLQFTAKLTGRFTYELHKSELELGALEVFPK
jgi:plastocyanin